jgi:hypothetical protein
MGVAEPRRSNKIPIEMTWEELEALTGLYFSDEELDDMDNPGFRGGFRGCMDCPEPVRAHRELGYYRDDSIFCFRATVASTRLCTSGLPIV